MNQTVTVNISGLVFYIEVNAYDQLKKYLDTIKLYFSNEEGQEEIIADIEARIAELLKEKLSDGQEVVTQAHVEQVIEVMGEPEAYIDEDAQPEEPRQKTKEKFSSKKLFRDEDDNVLGGVCAGAGHYFGIDKIWFRIAFLVAFFGYGAGLLLYLILWIIIPSAKTTAEKLEMKGEPINVDSIGNAIKSEFNSFKKKVNTNEVENIGQRIVQFFYQIFNFIIKLITFLLQFIVKAISVILMLASAILLISLITLFFGGSTNIRFQNIQLDESWLSSYADVIFSSPTLYTVGVIGISLVVLIPVLGIFYGSIKLLFNFSANNKAIGLSAVSLWVIGVILIFISATTTVSEFSSKQSFLKTESLSNITSDTLVLNQWQKNNGILFEDHQFYVQNDSLYINDLIVDVVESKSDQMELYYNFSARGSNRKVAAERAQKVDLQYKVVDNQLFIKEFIVTSVDEKYRNQQLKLSIGLPIGKSIYLNENSEQLIYDIKNVSNTYDGKMLNHHWKMTEKGLMCTDCKWLEEEDQLNNTKDTEDEEDSFEI